MVRSISGYKLGLWLGAAVAVLLLMACGGPAAQDGNSNENEASGSGSSSNTSGNQDSRTGSKGNSSGSSIVAADACGAFSWVTNLSTSSFNSQFGDTSVDASRSAPSDFAAEVAKFAEESLEDALNESVSADCYIESKTPQGGSVYVGLSIPGDPAAGAAQAVGEAMKARGGNVLGSYSSSAPEGKFDLVSLQNIPVEPPSGAIAMGALYFITTTEGDHQAVMLASYSDQAAQVSPVVPSSTLAPSVPVQVNAVTPTGTAGEINEDIKGALEDALGRDLVVESFFQTSAGGQDSASLIYHTANPVEFGLASGAFSKVVEDLDGGVTAAFSNSEVATVLFENVKAGGYTASGNFSYGDNRVIISIISLSK